MLSFCFKCYAGMQVTFFDNPHHLSKIASSKQFLQHQIFFSILQGVIQLEKELANLGGVCAAALMKKDLALPIYLVLDPFFFPSFSVF